MVADTLRTIHNIPLEREFESWIVWGIENYLESVGREYSIHAITPGLETTWPADESLTFSGKVVGLQMKQAIPAPLKQDQNEIQYDRIKWTFAQPAGQHRLVYAHPEIFYCLPTFLNREYRREAIHHCLFWRPDDPGNHNAWYNNPDRRVQTPHNPLNDQPRWGLFYENIVRCRAGGIVNSRGDVDQFLTNLQQTMREFDVPFVWDEPPTSDEQPRKDIKNWGGFYVLVIEM